jgi:hypothetical protein
MNQTSDMSRRVSAVRRAAREDFAATLAATVELMAADLDIELTPETAVEMADAAVAAMIEASGRGELFAMCRALVDMGGSLPIGFDQ